MKNLQSLLAVVFASLIAVAVSYGGEGQNHRKQVALALGGEDAVVADVSDLEPGESRQLYAGDKEVVITNTEDGLQIELDGEVIDIGGDLMHIDSEHGDHHQVFTSSQSKVIVKHLDGEGDGHGFHFITGDGEDVEIDVDADHEWIDHDGERKVVMFNGGGSVVDLGGEIAAAKLEASGALDDLDDDKREEILEALRGQGNSDVAVEKRVVVIRQGDHEE